jgi:hypothetical protein
MLLATEFDLLFHEPQLLAQCRAAAEKSWARSANLYGTALSSAGAHFATGAPYVAVGAALFITETQESAGVVAIAGDALLTVTQPHPRVDPTDPTAAYPVAPLAQGLVTIEAYVFPQLRPATERVLADLGVAPSELLSPTPLRRACSHAALTAIFRSMAATDRSTYTAGAGHAAVFTPNDRWDNLADAHEAAYHDALRAARVEWDRNRDGASDLTGTTGVPRVVRG